MFPTVQNNITDLSIALKQSKVDTQSTGSKAFLRFDFKSGAWAFGKNQDDVTGDTVIINTYSIQHGWILWVDRKVSKEMRSFTQEKPPAMPSVGDESPSEARSMECRFEDDETIVVFETSSYGGRGACDTLLKEIMKKASEGEQNFLFPVVELKSDEGYKSKKGGYVFNPIFDVINWADVDGNLEEQVEKLEEKPEIEETETPKRRRRQA